VVTINGDLPVDEVTVNILRAIDADAERAALGG
jgi:hypothetical protein